MRLSCCVKWRVIIPVMAYHHSQDGVSSYTCGYHHTNPGYHHTITGFHDTCNGFLHVYNGYHDTYSGISMLSYGISSYIHRFSSYICRSSSLQSWLSPCTTRLSTYIQRLSSHMRRLSSYVKRFVMTSSNNHIRSSFDEFITGFGEGGRVGSDIDAGGLHCFKKGALFNSNIVSQSKWC